LKNQKRLIVTIKPVHCGDTDQISGSKHG
jgi:hypothetical protein